MTKKQEPYVKPDPNVKKLSKEKQLEVENERLKALLQQQHIIVRELAAFTQGIVLCELVDNPSVNRGYDEATMRLGNAIRASEELLLRA